MGPEGVQGATGKPPARARRRGILSMGGRVCGPRQKARAIGQWNATRLYGHPAGAQLFLYMVLLGRSFRLGEKNQKPTGAAEARVRGQRPRTPVTRTGDGSKPSQGATGDAMEENGAHQRAPTHRRWRHLKRP